MQPWPATTLPARNRRDRRMRRAVSEQVQRALVALAAKKRSSASRKIEPSTPAVSPNSVIDEQNFTSSGEPKMSRGCRMMQAFAALHPWTRCHSTARSASVRVRAAAGKQTTSSGNACGQRAARPGRLRRPAPGRHESAPSRMDRQRPCLADWPVLACAGE